MEAAGIDSAISSPPDPVSVGGATIGAGPGVVFSRYIEDEGGTLAHGASAVIEQWAEPIDDDEAHVHRIWFERDPGGSSSIDWLSPGYYPTRLDVTLRVSTGSLLCHGFPSGGYGCSGEGTPETIGSMRLVATIPEPNSVAQTAGATIALAVLARRRKCVQNLSRRAIRASGRRLT